jgi:hypothetical protein
MTTAIRMIGWSAALTLALAAASPLHAAITPQLARTCRAMMIKAHPIELFGRDGSAAAQRHYFAECVARNADMPKAKGDAAAAAPASTTGQGR